MSFLLNQSKLALAPGLTASFMGVGGVEPYVYSVRSGGAGGSINPTTGLYVAPPLPSSDPLKVNDVVQVADATGAKRTASILVGNALLLLCDIIRREMELAEGRVYLWDQKNLEPSDNDLFIAISVPSCKPFSNIIRQGTGGWNTAVQTVNMYAVCDIDIQSRGPSARDRKEEVILALNSIYAQSQQEMNSFLIGKLPPGAQFINLSGIDGAAIPYRYRISVALQYAVTKTKAVDYFDDFEDVQINTNP